jgi:hypothetical protein
MPIFHIGPQKQYFCRINTYLRADQALVACHLRDTISVYCPPD